MTRRQTTTTPAAEAREVRDSRRAYVCALADRLADLLHDTDAVADAHAAEASDIVDSLYALLRVRSVPLLPAAGEGR